MGSVRKQYTWGPLGAVHTQLSAGRDQTPFEAENKGATKFVEPKSTPKEEEQDSHSGQ